MILLLLSCAVGDRVDIQVDGVSRNYYLVAPKQTSNTPLVMVFHGGGSSGARKGKRFGDFTGFADLAEREGFIAVFPSSFGGNWDDGRPSPYRPPDDVDDLRFVEAVLEEVRGGYDVDPDRIFAAGMSNGGFFTNRLACERTSLFSGFANVVGGMPANYACTPTAPAPMVLIAGTGDPIVPYNGGAVGGDAEGRGELLPQEQNQTFWREHNGCPAMPEHTSLPDLDTRDRSTVTLDDSQGCAGAPMRSFVIESGGHGWPGGSQYLPRSVIGPINGDIQGERVIWDFFSAL